MDLALTGVQLALPTDDCKYIARLNGRTTPRNRLSLSRSSAGTSGGVEVRVPGASLGEGVFEEVLSHRRDILDSAGRRVQSFVQAGGAFRILELAWADAAYWFHEGIAEPLDTIAVAKLETSIEVLLRAESTKGSERRVLDSIKAFFGLNPPDFIAPQSQLTVKRFAKDLVRDRSRVLHGTWSTLTHSLRLSRPMTESLAGSLLVNYSLYIKSPDATDALEPFLAFASTIASTKRQGKQATPIRQQAEP